MGRGEGRERATDLFDGIGVDERPPSTDVRLSYFLTRVAAANVGTFSWGSTAVACSTYTPRWSARAAEGG